MDIFSTLIISFLVAGDVHESEIRMKHTACMSAAAAITRDIDGPRIPTVELINGSRVPMVSAECLPACMADGEPLELLALAE